MARYNEDGDRLYPCVNGYGWDTADWDHSDEVDHRYPLHEGEYDPNHWGELDPDAYDRMGYAQYGEFYDLLEIKTHGRHLLDTGVN